MPPSLPSPHTSIPPTKPKPPTAMATASLRRSATPPALTKNPCPVLDPGSDAVVFWHRLFLFSCLISLFLDPLYLYFVDVGGPLCMRFDFERVIVVSVFRSATDLFYLVHIVIKFRTAFVSPSSRVFGKGELVEDPRQIAMRYLKGEFFVDLAAMVPIPQIAVLFVIPAVTGSTANPSSSMLALTVLVQYALRLFLIFPLNMRIVNATRDLMKTAWAGATYNLLLYLLASHVVGALWYFLSMERQHTCWATACSKEYGTQMPMCNPSFLDCSSLEQPERKSWLNSTLVRSYCNATDITSSFHFGIFAAALSNELNEASFSAKYLYCLWWGLQQLSSYGQNMATSTFIGETSFSVLVCTLGLILFAHLIGNIQTYLQSITVRLEEWRIKQRDIEEWMKHRQLPEALRDRVWRFFQYKWLATRGVDEESVLRALPLDLRRAIQRNQCLSLVCCVPFFSEMDDQLLDAICERLFSFLSTKGTYIIRECDPVNVMLFIIRGRLESSTTDGGRSGFFNSITLIPGDFCGEELLTWALMPNSHANLPPSTRTVRALEEVEAFALRAEDLKFVANQFKRLHSKKLQHTFRYYSQQWRTWGACYIQAAWRRFKKRKLAKELAERELLYCILHGSGSRRAVEMPVEHGNGKYVSGDGSAAESVNNFLRMRSTSVTSELVKNTVRGEYQKIEQPEPSTVSIQMRKLMRPDEPNFSINSDGPDGTI